MRLIDSPAMVVPHRGGTPPAPGVPKPDFRPDINALRALAVGLVVLFHYGFAPLSGGFEGVDVFFVISGFLMSRIIAGGLDRGTFSIWSFYLARARRIVPALLVMCVVVVLAGLLVVDPMTAGVTGQNAAWALLFVSNVQFALANSYFADASDGNLLLHTWTLGVEWQFYIVYPLVLMAAFRFPRLWRRRWSVTVGVTLLILVATVWFCATSAIHFQLGFFLLPTRAWELLAGACVAFAPPLGLTRAMSLGLKAMGLGLIVGSALVYTEFWPWPSLWTAVPVAGAVAYLAGETAELPFTRWAPVQALGTYSYSIYLWHWPVVVGLRYAFGPLGLPLLVAGLVATLLLSVLSYHWVETRLARLVFPKGGLRPPGLVKPDPSKPVPTPIRLAWAQPGLLLWAIAIVLCVVAWRTDGLERFRTRDLDAGTQQRLADYEAATHDWAGRAPCGTHQKDLLTGHLCWFGDEGRSDVIVLGDSHVEQLLPRYGAPGKVPPDLGVTFLYRNGCSPLPDLEDRVPGMNCVAFARTALDYAKRRHFKKVVMVAAWTVYFLDRQDDLRLDAMCLNQPDGGCLRARDAAQARRMITLAFDGFERALADLRASGAEVVVVGIDPIVGGDTATSLYRRTFLARSPILLPPFEVASFEQRNAVVSGPLLAAARQSGAELIDPLDHVCPGGRCPLYQDEHFIFKDGNHVRASVMKNDRYDYLDRAILGTAPP